MLWGTPLTDWISYIKIKLLVIFKVLRLNHDYKDRSISMVNKINKDIDPQIQKDKGYRVSRRVIILILIVVALLALACSITEVGFFAPDDKLIKDMNETLQVSQLLNPDEPVSTPEQPVANEDPSSLPVDLPGSVSNNGGINEYSVSAQDFNCICSVSGNVNVELHVNGDQLEIIDPDGNAQVFDKIGENTYKRSWMGYYIDTTDGKETKVDEEKSVIIILTGTGYIMEHYKGSEGSPCCIYTFTKEN
jgi:hypothetical protein